MAYVDISEELLFNKDIPLMSICREGGLILTNKRNISDGVYRFDLEGEGAPQHGGQVEIYFKEIENGEIIISRIYRI